jgi:hypothetical protein
MLADTNHLSFIPFRLYTCPKTTHSVPALPAGDKGDRSLLWLNMRNATIVYVIKFESLGSFLIPWPW